MSQVKDGDKVKVQYTGKLENGDVFESSKNREPLEFRVGSGTVMPGVEKGVVGMEVGDAKTLEVKPEDAFGPRREELVVEVQKSDLPDNIKPSIGQQLQMRQPEEGDPVKLVITDMNEETLTLDANHPLAGYTLFIDIELLEIS